MKVLGVQIDSVWEDPRANFGRVERLLAESPPSPAALVVLPEMFSTGFSLDLSKTMQGAARETEQFLRMLAMRHRATVMGGVVSAGADGRGRNESVAFNPGGELLARYVKQRPFSGAGEDAVHEAGTEAVVFPLGAFTVAPLICYDLRFPELFRSAARRGADLFVVIAAWPVKRIDHWLTLLRARAIENQAFVVGVNRCGSEPHFAYSGRSVVVNPHGAITADAGESETVMFTELDHTAVQSWRAEFPALRDAGWEQ
jgi:predicted amidohydrolase